MHTGNVGVMMLILIASGISLLVGGRHKRQSTPG
jgi:hypothetical protein